MQAVYLDSSALVKLVIGEDESPALREYLRRRPTRVTCGLARVEVPRAVRAHGRPATVRARQLLDRLLVLRVDDLLLDEPADLADDVLRSLDAIHLSAARALGPDLAEVVTYDRRMIEAAERLGLPTAAPG